MKPEAKSFTVRLDEEDQKLLEDAMAALDCTSFAAWARTAIRSAPPEKKTDPMQEQEVRLAVMGAHEEGVQFGIKTARESIDSEWTALRAERSRLQEEVADTRAEIDVANREIAKYSADSQAFIDQAKQAGFAECLDLQAARGIFDSRRYAQAVEDRAEALLSAWVVDQSRKAPVHAWLTAAADIFDGIASRTNDAPLPGEVTPSNLASSIRQIARMAKSRGPAIEANELPATPSPTPKNFKPLHIPKRLKNVDYPALWDQGFSPLGETTTCIQAESEKADSDLGALYVGRATRFFQALVGGDFKAFQPLQNWWLDVANKDQRNQMDLCMSRWLPSEWRAWKRRLENPA